MKIPSRVAAVLTSVIVLGLASLAAPASATKPGPGHSYAFFKSGNALAGWVTTPADSDGDTYSIRLSVLKPRSDAGVSFSALNGVAIGNITNMSYDFMGNAGGGSPRLVVQFSDGGNVLLYPSAPSGTWTNVNWTQNFDNSGGTCGFLYQQPWAIVSACHAGTTATNAFIVVDSGWMFTPFTSYIDNVNLSWTTGSLAVTQP